MKTKAYKAELVQYLIELQEQAISNARKAMDDAQEEANNYGAPKDRYDGFRNQQLRRKDLFAKQLSQAMTNLDLLNRLDETKQHHEVGFGTLVQTEKAMFFVAIGLGIVNFKGEDIAVISMLVPLFHAMKSKKVGESFSFNQNDFTIKQLV